MNSLSADNENSNTKTIRTDEPDEASFCVLMNGYATGSETGIMYANPYLSMAWKCRFGFQAC